MRLAFSAALFSLAMVGTNAQIPGLPDGLISGLSTSCLGGLASLFSNEDLNSCLQLSQALTTFGAAGQNDSLVQPLQMYLSSQICPKAPCSQATLTSANTTVAQACSAELASGNSTVPSILVFLLSDYDTVRTAACLEDTTQSDQLCIIQSLTNVQSASGSNLSLNALLALDSTSEQALIMSYAQNQSALCSDCNKALLTTLSPLASSSSNSSAFTQLGTVFTQECGANSIGTIPSTIRASATGNSTSNSTSSSSGGTSHDGVTSKFTVSLAAVAFGALSLAGLALLA